MDPDETKRLADQREKDLQQVRERESQLSYERGLKDARDAAHDEETRVHFSKINGSIDTFNNHLASIENRMTGMEKSFGEFTAVSRAMSDKTVSTRTFVLGVLALIISVAIPLLLTLHT